MIIDFHTHAFPDKIAERTVAALGRAANMTPLTDGTVKGLREKLSSGGVDVGVVLPVVTKPEQFSSINRFAAAINEENDGLVSFGGIHPDDEDPEGHLEEIRSLGLKGLKIHPDYQGTYIDDEKYCRIVKKATELGLITVIHAGVDVGFRDHPVRCTPERAVKLIEAVEEGKTELPIVFAHGGGYEMHREVMELLAGKGIYIDLSMTHKICTKAEIEELVRVHGAERILFGTDCPWGDPAETVEFVRSLDITDGEKELILHKNAERLLGI